MKKLALLALVFVITGCSQFNADRYADVAVDLATARANGLGEKHPNRVALEQSLDDLASPDPAENQAAITARIQELEAESKSLRANPANEMGPRADAIDKSVVELKKFNQ